MLRILMRQKSAPMLVLLVGCQTEPIENCLDFSGCRFGLPPVHWFTCRPVWWVAGSLNSSEVPRVCGVHMSARVGARKPVPYEARNSSDLTGCQRALAL